jgi:hypothetical protein
VIVRNDIEERFRGPRFDAERDNKKMKLTKILGQSNRSFASVFLAFSLFGFLFPHHANQVKENHHVNLTTIEQVPQQEPADDGSVYEWFY